MRILVLAPQFPYPLVKGIKIRLFNLVRQLARRHEVHLAVLTQPEDPDPCPELEAVCTAITRLPPPRQVWDPNRRSSHLEDLAHMVAKVVARRPNLVNIHLTPAAAAAIRALPMSGVDVIFCFRTYLYPAAIEIAGQRPVVVDFDDIEHVKFAAQSKLAVGRMTALLDRWESRKLEAWELGIAHRAAASFVCSATDRNRFPASCRDRIHLLPNGADFGESGGPVAGEVPTRLLMLGDMGYFPNVDGAVAFCQRVLPAIRERVPGVEVAIVGNHPDPAVRALERLPGVRVTGFVPDVAPWFQSAAVLVVPLRFGGGTRLKILEALRWRRAVVSTPAGCEGLDPVPGKHLIVASSDAEFAAAVVELVNDPARRRALGAEGFAWARATYGWDRIGDGLLAAIDRVAARRG